jgi:hypothetical protein
MTKLKSISQIWKLDSPPKKMRSDVLNMVKTRLQVLHGSQSNEFFGYNSLGSQWRLRSVFLQHRKPFLLAPLRVNCLHLSFHVAQMGQPQHLQPDQSGYSISLAPVIGSAVGT